MARFPSSPSRWRYAAESAAAHTPGGTSPGTATGTAAVPPQSAAATAAEAVEAVPVVPSSPGAVGPSPLPLLLGGVPPAKPSFDGVYVHSSPTPHKQQQQHLRSGGSSSGTASPGPGSPTAPPGTNGWRGCAASTSGALEPEPPGPAGSALDVTAAPADEVWAPTTTSAEQQAGSSSTAPAPSPASAAEPPAAASGSGAEPRAPPAPDAAVAGVAVYPPRLRLAPLLPHAAAAECTPLQDAPLLVAEPSTLLAVEELLNSAATSSQGGSCSSTSTPPQEEDELVQLLQGGALAATAPWAPARPPGAAGLPLHEWYGSAATSVDQLSGTDDLLPGLSGEEAELFTGSPLRTGRSSSSSDGGDEQPAAAMAGEGASPELPAVLVASAGAGE